jgi:leukotriene-A4 hydrolase
LTFVTPTLLAGDRTLVDVVAHEIAHSWCGNLVGCKSWEHFWLNEGWTVFVERKIISKGKGEKVRHFNSLIGLSHLKESVDHMKAIQHPEYTCLCPRLLDTDPDDVFSSVPYEKGFNLLFYLEQLLGGPTVFEPYMKAHIIKFSQKAITTEDFKSFLYEYFASKIDVLDTVDWNNWFHGTGMPPVDNKFDRTLLLACEDLSQIWLQNPTPSINNAAFEKMDTNQR